MLHQSSLGSSFARSARRRAEWEADQFAVELLLPTALMRRYALNAQDRTDDLAARLVVSPTVLRRRLHELRAASPS